MNYIKKLLEFSNKSDFHYDFSNILYLVNNQQRVLQINSALISEMAENNIITIIPPAVMHYKTGFLYLAAEIVLKYYDKARITEFSEEWIEFLMYATAAQTVNKLQLYDKFHEVENRRKNLIRDFRYFLSEVVLNLKENQMKNILLKKGSFPDDYFKGAYEKYETMQAKKYNHKFFNAFTGYKELYSLLSRGLPDNFDKTIIVEDYDDMERIFKEICDNLGTFCKKIDKRVYLYDADKPQSVSSKEIYEYMTPLDEAEAVAYQIKKMLSKGVKVSEIGLVCASDILYTIFLLVFDRYGISITEKKLLRNTDEFILFRAFYDIICGRNVNLDNYLEILSNPSSMYLIQKQLFYKIKKELFNFGYIAYREPVKSIQDAIYYIETDNTFSYKEKADDIKTVKNFLTEINSPKYSSFIDIFKSVVKIKEKTQIAHYLPDIIKAVEEMDRISNEVKNYIEIDEQFVKSLFDIAGSREYKTDNEKQPWEKMDFFKNPITPQKSNIVVIPLVSADNADNINARILFICGMDSSFDKRKINYAPFSMISELGLETPEEKHKKIVKKIINALNSAEKVIISYSYLDMRREVAGPSNLIRTLKEDNSFIKNINKDTGFLRGYDIISKDEIQTPDESYKYYIIDKEKKFPYIITDFFEKFTIKDVFKQYITKKTDVIYLRVTDIVNFVICPRRFGFNILSEAAGIFKPDFIFDTKCRKGAFFHKVFELAASLKDFYSKDENLVRKTLQTGLEQAMDKNSWTKEIVSGNNEELWNPEIFFRASKTEFVRNTTEVIFPVFASNEVKRQKELSISGALGLEKELFYEIQSNNGEKYIIESKIDRIDLSKNKKIYLWDYKTGKVKVNKISLFDKDNNFFHKNSGESGVQMCLYMYLFRKSKIKEIDDCMGYSVSAGNIFINGFDNMKRPEARTHTPEFLENDKNEYLCERAINKFIEFLNKPIKYLIEDDSYSSSLFKEKNEIRDYEYGNCSYCDCNFVCKNMDIIMK